jgi:hypothetical protein
LKDKPVDITADEVIIPESSIESPQLDRATEWLKEILGEVDSMPSKEIYEMAKKKKGLKSKL